MMNFNALLVCLAVFRIVGASFSVYQYYDPATMEDYYGISSECMAAVNMTLDCDVTNANRAANGVDVDYWYQDNITTLCTDACATSMTNWLSAVEAQCGSEDMTFEAAIVDPRIVPLTYTEGFDMACLQDSDSNWCFFESQSWQGSDYIRWNEDTCYSDDPPVECDDPTFSVYDISGNMSAVTNLYDKSLYCSECFLKVWRQRLLAPKLAASEFTNYLISQFDDLQGNCSTTLPYTTSAATLYRGTATSTAAASTTSQSSPTTTCSGQLLDVVSPPLGCNEISDTYNVTTGAIRAVTNDFFCTITSPVCLPLPCDIETIWGGVCTEIAGNLSTSITSFLTWNSNIQGSCDNLAAGQRICTSVPGGKYISSGTIFAPTSVGQYYTTATPAVPTQSGSIDDCGNYYDVVAGDTCNQIALVNGITFADLQLWNTYLNSGCTNLWLNYAVCVAKMTQPAISADGTCGPDNNYTTCVGSNFGSCCSMSGFCGSTTAYCGAGECYSGACNGTSSGVTTDGTCGPNTGGLLCQNPLFGPCCSTSGYCGNGTDYCGAGNCYSGSCDTDIGGLSTTGECGPLFAGNKTCTGTQFGTCCSTDGYCGNGTDYCSSGHCYSGACEASTTTSITPPGPTQTGIAANCNAYYLTPSTGSSCASIEALYNITFAQFYAWNPAVGSNCGSLWLGEAYCVGVSG